MLQPFLIVEGKSCAGVTADAENQAIRGGATLVRVRRELHARAKDYKIPEAEGPDLFSFVFSCTITPQVATTWVHWCHHSGSADTYHMNRISEHLMSRHHELIDLRRNLHNIMDWGGLERRESNSKLVSALMLVEKSKASLPSRTISPAKSHSGTTQTSSSPRSNWTKKKKSNLDNSISHD